MHIKKRIRVMYIFYLLEINGKNHIGVLYSYFMKSTKIHEIR